MTLPRLDDPSRYRGLYVYDFGDWSAVGYTADEVAILLEDPNYRGGKIFRIQRASPDGTMELRGVPADRFQLESGMFFYRRDLQLARDDFRALCDAADDMPPSFRAFAHLADRGEDAGPTRFVTALIYPSEYEDDAASWLTTMGYSGGDVAEGGISMATNYYQDEKQILARRQLWSAATLRARSADEVLANVRHAVQR